MKKHQWIPTLLAVLLAFVLLAQGAQDPAPKSVVTKEALQERIASLEQARQQAIANVNALGGAIQECTYWLQRLEAAEAEAKKQADKPKPPPEKKE